jgi:hypothetical protein
MHSECLFWIDASINYLLTYSTARLFSGVQLDRWHVIRGMGEDGGTAINRRTHWDVFSRFVSSECQNLTRVRRNFGNELLVLYWDQSHWAATRWTWVQWWNQSVPILRSPHLATSKYCSVMNSFLVWIHTKIANDTNIVPWHSCLQFRSLSLETV